MADNPRIEDLRKRIEKDPGSRLFAQLAEELRKDGELEDAIRVAREGLRHHPNYPSARMTLGRALLDTGDWAAAKTEFENVLKGAPDNILAGRYLAECLENLGDRDGALARYKATLAMGPGEKHVIAKIQELEKGGAKAGAAPPLAPGLRPPTTGAFARPPAMASAAARPAVPVPPAAPPPPPAPARAPAPPAEDPAPIPLVDADEEFELERPYESPTTAIGTGSVEHPAAPAPAPKPIAPPAAPPSVSTPAAPSAASPPPPSADEPEFELEAPYEAPAARWTPSIPPLPAEAEPAPAQTRAQPPAPEPVRPAPFTPPPIPAPAPAPAPTPPAVSAEPAAPAAPLASATLGELYFNQGFTDKAIEVYRQLSAREPGNDRLRARLRELEAIQRSLEPAAAAPASPAPPAPPPAPAPPPPAPAPVAAAGFDPAGERRQAIERTIGRLEDLLSAIRKG